MPAADGTPHLPGCVAIDAYGAGGFRFGGMSHRGGLLALPSGMWAWPAQRAQDIDLERLQRVVAERDAIDLLLIGTGVSLSPLPEAVVWGLRGHRVRFEVMATPAAVRTFSVLMAEGRRVAAALLAVD